MTFTLGFKLHLRGGEVIDGAVFPSGRALVEDDSEFGFGSAAPSLEQLLAGYHGARVKWPDQSPVASVAAPERPDTKTLEARTQAIADAIGPTMLIGLGDAELFGAAGAQRIREWVAWISKTVAALPAAPAQPAKDAEKREVVHGCPPAGSVLTPCCARTPFELPRTDRLSTELALVTCQPVVLAAPAAGAEVQHIGGRANAEDCPACANTNPPWPFICPGPAAPAAPAKGGTP
ncbi:hypothetical protein ACFXAZ_33305 [Streptomyces sp. NPDC059477]|uniref:hypothetical protein n=1 Tax=Streptomyces sp. NPDC059477 TaxID=3346847 RepID=UPI0036C7D0FD